MSKKDLAAQIKEAFPEFYDSIHSGTSEELDVTLAKFAKHLQEVSESKSADEKLEEAKKLVAFLSEPYRDAKKALQLKSRYIISILRERGHA